MAVAADCRKSIGLLCGVFVCFLSIGLLYGVIVCFVRFTGKNRLTALLAWIKLFLPIIANWFIIRVTARVFHTLFYKGVIWEGGSMAYKEKRKAKIYSGNDKNYKAGSSNQTSRKVA